MARKKYSLAVMFALWLLALYTFFNYTRIVTHDGDDAYSTSGPVIAVCVILLTAMLVAALWMLHFRQKTILMHICVGITAVFLIVIGIINFIIPIIFAVILGVFYLLSQFLLKKEQDTGNDNFYFYGVLLFALLCILADSFFWEQHYTRHYSADYDYIDVYSNISLSPGYFSVFAVLIAALYALLFCKIKLKPFVAYLMIGLCIALSFTSLMINYQEHYFSYFDYYWRNILGELLIQLVLLGGYILFDVLRKKVPAKRAESAPGQTEPSLDEKIAQLHDLQTLREAGVLTEEEFQTQKQKILGGNKHV